MCVYIHMSRFAIHEKRQQTKKPLAYEGVSFVVMFSPPYDAFASCSKHGNILSIYESALFLQFLIVCKIEYFQTSRLQYYVSKV